MLILRETTERPEIVESGAGRLVGTDTTRIVGETSLLLQNDLEYRQMTNIPNPFGDVHASERIVEIIKDVL